MDKIMIVCGLIVGMLLMLCFAGISEAAEESRIFIGWSSRDITPDKPVSLYGQYYKRISKYVQSPLKVSALALETRSENGEKEQALIVSCDVINVRRTIQELLREKVRARIPDFEVNKLFLHATHTHSARRT